MKRLLLAALFAGTLLACATVKPPQVQLPTFAPLPPVAFTPGPDGAACLDPANATALRQREQLRNLREQVLTDMLKEMGATPAAK